MSHIKSMSERMKDAVDRIMADGVKRNRMEVVDELYRIKRRGIPTRGELQSYLSANYSSTIRREKHPLALPYESRTVKVVYYFKEVVE